MRKFLFGLAPLLAVVAFALVPSGASALVQCRVLTSGKSQNLGVECNNPPGVAIPQNLRDNTTDTPNGFGTDGLAVNTKGGLRVSLKIGGVAIRNSVPEGYAFLGLKLETNED